MSLDTAANEATSGALPEPVLAKSTEAAGPHAAVIAAIKGHHAELSARADALTEAVITAAASGKHLQTRDSLRDWYRDELLPHAAAEEKALYHSASELDVTRLLIRGMLAEHRVLEGLVAVLAEATEAIEVATVAASARAVFAVHVSKENDLLLPALAEAGVDLTTALSGMHKLLGHADAAASDDGCGCGCGCADEAGAAPARSLPIVESSAPSSAPSSVELDVRALPHGARHEIIFGKLDQLKPGESLIIVNDHDPKPLRYQTSAMWPGRFAWNYVESGPVIWRVAIIRAD